MSSVYGEGSAFSFRLKQEIIDLQPMGNYEQQLSAGDRDGQTGEYLYAPEADVLVVDDNSMNLKVAQNLLSLYGIKSDTADSGRKALEKIKQRSYDVIFLDHMMPEMDGIEVIREIRSASLVSEQTVIIALTANAIMGAKEMYISEGFNGYLTKPIESRELEKLLRKTLPESKKQLRSVPASKKRGELPAEEDSFSAAEIRRLFELCPGLNVAAGLHNCMDSREFWMDTLAGFIEADKAPQLEKAFEEKNYELYRITVHSIKSAAKTVGADVVSEHARQLEAAAAAGDTGYINANHAEFIKEYRDLINNIERVKEL